MPLSDPVGRRKSIIDFHLAKVEKGPIVMLNNATLYCAFTLKLGVGVRGHVNKALDYATAPSARVEYLIVNRAAQDQ